MAGRRDSSDPTSSSSWSGTGRFITGTILVGRYRIVSALGRGGMGEVYRAEDITLQQEIALKFLPAELTNDPAALERFHREVRIARQVSHPNVCRVFDIGVSDGASFITMEYVDGEDLSSLIRRIGRFPQDKGLEIARQICAGLAAAHEQGLLHRDLKPANVMLDGRGRVRVTDFGLATLAAEAHGADVRSGTPAYMAPEQLAGTGVTLKSDIYALGLVLYEIFTGKRAFDAPTVAELNRVRESSVPASPTTLVKELDPLIERVIQRCLEKDPERRPASALQVAAALPGGNPLAAALAAGELPSPEMVAAAGNKEGIRPRYVWASIGVVAICILIEFLLSGQTRIYRTVGFPKPPEVLADRAQDILRGMGYTATPGDTATGFDVDGDYLNYVEKHDTSATRWNHVTGAVQFWYRESRTDMLATQILSGSVQGRVTEGDPRVDEPGMKIMHLDPQGRLEYLRVAPLRKVSTKTASPPETDWNRLLTEAGFDPANCTRADSEWIPYSYADARAAWTASMPERPDVTLHVEAASFQGKPVYFSIFAPWTPSGAAGLTGANRVQAISAVLIVGLMLVGGIILAWKNLKLKRADLKGSLRLAGFVFCLTLATWAIGASHVASLIEAYSLTLALSWASLAAIFLWMMYVALEPFVRRRMPTLVISWNRLLAGQFRDPMVGRDLLVGISTALFFVSLSNLDIPYAAMRRLPPPMPSTNLVAISGGRLIFSMLLSTVNSAILDALAFLFLVVILQWVLRNRWLAVAGFVAIFTVRAYLQGGPAFDIALNAIALAAIGFLMFRFGLVAVVAFQFTDNIISGAPITTQGSAWYAWMGWLGVAVIAAIVIYAARIGLAGQPLFGRALTADD
ncbi:MAG TPA: serine/threonine-protein kinase [Candidatus Acidoferrales bacterium]|nr:serine/threonine-protein kinase [Candidatus Acidoferrales bacterium]